MRFRPIDKQPPISVHQQTSWPPGAGERSPASPSREGAALADLHARCALAASPAPPVRSLPAEVLQVARVPGAVTSPRTESAAQLCCGTRTASPAAAAAEPRLPPRGAPPPRPRGPGGSGQGAAPEHLGWVPAAGAALPELRAPRLQVLRPRRAGRVTAPPAWLPSGQQTRCGQLAGTGKEEALRLGPTGEDRASRAGRDAGARAPPPPVSPPEPGGPRARGVPGATEWAGGVDPAAVGGPSPVGPGLFDTFSGKFPERQVLGSGFSPLDFPPACGRLKGNQKRVSDTKNPLTNATWPGRVTIRMDS